MNHAWSHPEPHRYVCQRCGLEKRNRAELYPGGRTEWRLEFWRGEDLVATGKTPTCPGWKPPVMRWTSVSRYAWTAESGYTINALRRGEGWAYSAWTPERPDWRRDLKTHYALGETHPTPRAWLGTFATAADAREACYAHAARLEQKESE